MTTQLLLPIKRWDLPERHFRWFVLANSGAYSLKQTFYRLKANLLVEYGVQDGSDLQVIEKRCHACGGSGIWSCGSWNSEECYDCDGTGIYDTRRVHLQRWLLNGRIFHCPDGLKRADVAYRTTFTGLVTHDYVPASSARKAALRLLGIYRPKYLREIASRCTRRRLGAWIYAPTNLELEHEHWLSWAY